MKKAKANRLSKIARRETREEIRRGLLVGLREITSDFNQESVKFKTTIWRAAAKLSKRIAGKMKMDRQSQRQAGTHFGLENVEAREDKSARRRKSLPTQTVANSSSSSSGETSQPVIKSSPVIRAPLKKEVLPARPGKI